ncbi:retention module-containing protein [Shewanella sedimentimangrovi]|uniref:Retention module-containing protein n=1 Tax=Shewanella sedimentimangrovi TaxID=2814293 RepID=A0ABX7R165_9GAMM|nr:retention module-containing protein [Shewanella sedimentimangrovi]QSX36940.1 retention module-containing protein [Shewanella sedimentimangrovi]
MKSLITSQNSQVKSLDGKVYIVSNGLEQELRLGDALPQGSEILLADNANLELQLQDGSSFNSGEFSAPNESVSDAEIQQLQDLIAAGDDPTADLPATAAGGAPGNEGDSGFVSLVRDGAEALAGAGYDSQTILFSTGAAVNGGSEGFNLVAIANNDVQQIAEDTTATGNVLDNDSDNLGQTEVTSFIIDGVEYGAGTSITLTSGTFTLNADGSYIFTPAGNWNGEVPVISYSTNVGTTATLTIVVTPVDDATNAVNDFNTVAEDTVASGNVLDNDSDVDDDLTVVSFEVNGNSYSAGDSVELDGGTLVLNADGSYSFTPNDNWNGNVPVVTYTTNTGATATLTIVVTPVDDATNAVNDFNTVAEDTVASGNVLDNDSDVDDELSVVSFTIAGDETVYSAGDSVELDGGTLVLNADGSYSFTPNADWNGNVPVVTYTTNTGATATLTIVVTPVDDATNAVNDFNTVAEDTVASGNVLDNDSDVDDELSVVSFTIAGDETVYSAGDSVELDGGTLVLNADGSYSFTPNADWNGNVPVVTYTTNTGATATLTIVVTPVDDATNAVNDFNTAAEDTVASGNVLDNDSDVDDDLTVVSFEVNGNSYSAGDSVELDGGTLVLNADGSYSFTPNDNWNGNVPVVTYTTNTGATATLTIVVTPVDDATNAVNDFNTVAEDTVASGNVLDNDSDVDDELSVVSFEVNGNSYSAGDSVELDGGTLVLNADGSYSFTPNADWNGNVPVVTYTTNTGATATLTIVVTPVDDATNAVNDFNTVAEDTVASGNVLDNDSDVDDELSVVSFEVNGNSYSAGDSVELDGGTLVLNADGSYSFTPNDNWNGNVPVVTYTTNTGATATLTIVVTPVDDATNAVNDFNTVAEDTVASGNVLDNDSDIDSELSVVSFEVNGNSYSAGDSVELDGGTLVLNADGSYSFTPNADWNGNVPVVTYTTNTGATATLTIVVTPVDDATNAVNDFNTVAEDTVASGNVLDNDSDVDDELSVVSFEVNGNSYSAGDSVELDGGTLVLNADGSYSFTPNADWNGNVPVVTYTTNTGATATLTIVVTPVDDATNAVNDFNTVAEDTVASGNVLDNDSDVDDELSVVSFEVNGNSYSAGDSVELDGGTLVLNADGSYSFTPNADWNGNVPVVTYTTNTGATATLTIVVTPVDDATNAVNDFNTVAEDTVASGNVLDNDSDVDDELSVVSFEVNGNSYSAGDSVELDGGTLVLNADGSYSFTPNDNWNGNVPVVTYTTNTGATATLTIVVTPVDDATNAVNDFNTVAEDTVASGNVLDNDSDVDDELSVVSFTIAGDETVYSAGDSVELDGGTLVLNADGSYSFTPNADWNGNVPVVTYTTNTGATATLTIVVTPVDDATNAVNDFNTVAEDTVASGNVLDNDSDVDDELSVVSFTIAGDETVYSAGDSVELDGGTLVLNADGSYSFTPNADWNGNVPVVTYTTNTGATATLTIVVTPVDDATNAVNDFNTVAEDTVASGNVLDNDSDVDDELSVVSFEVNGNSYSAGDSVELDGGTLVLNADGSYSFTPNDNWNGNVPVVTYTTNTGATATLTIVVTPVDDATNAVNDFNTVAEDTVASGNVLDNDSDVDDELSVVSFEVNGNSYSAGDSVELDGGTLVLNADGSYSFTPNADWNGNVPVVTYTTNTGATATLTIVVTPVDDATNAVNDFNTVAEDTVASGNVLDNDSDVDDELSVVSFEVNGNSYSAGDSVELDGGTLVLNADGSYSFTPNADWNGNVPVVTYTTNTGATATLTIVVTPVDDATNAVNDFNTVAEDTVASGNVLDNDSDVDDELSVVSFEVNGNSYSAGDSVELDGGTLVLNADGSYSFTPNDNWNGNVPVVTYTTNTGATATLTIVVTPVDDATNAVNDFNTVAEDTVASGNVLDNDSDVDDELSVVSFTIAGDETVYSAGDSVELDGGTLVLNADGSYSFTPNADWNGNVPVVTYTTNTGATATLTIVVTPVDDATNAVNDFNTVAEDTVASGNVLDNDSDVDDELSVVSFTIAGDETVYSAGDSVELDGGTLVLNADGSYSFTPNADWNGNVPVVTYTTNTGATATLTIVVTPVDDATNAVNDFNTVAEDTVASGNVLDNDSDVDDELSVVSFEVNGNSYSAGDSVELDGGTLVLNADGSYSFTPNDNWNGNVPVVTYTTNTGATATLTIVVTPVDDATNAVNDFNTVAEDTVASGNVLDNDSDVDDELSVVSFEVNGNSYSAGDSVELDGGTLVLNADGSYSFTPNADWNGNVPVVTYTTNTGATATLTIVVTPVDDATNAVNDFNTVAEDTVASGNVLDNDSDVDDDLTVVSFEVNGNSYSAGDSVELDGGTLVLNADGSYSFTPNDNWNGNVPVVTYTTNTGATATLTIVVTPVDDATNAVNDFNTVAEDTVASGNVLDNDSDVDDELSVVSFEVNGNSYSAGDSVELDGGTLVLNADGSYSFTPNADWNGNVPVVTYTTNTGATATLTIVVTPVDDATNAVNDFNTVAEDTVASGNVLDNDSDVDDDLTVVSFEVNGNSYSASDSVELDGGTLVLNADGSYSFTPNADWNGNVPVVTYTTNTGATATLTIVVTPVDDATNAVNDFNTVAEDTVASGNVLDNDSDVDDELSVVSFEVNGNSYSAGDSVELDGGTLVLNADGSYSFTPNADWNGNVPVVTYTTNTGATATLTIVVTPVDDATNAVNDFNTVAEDTVASGNVLDNDSDIDSELSVVSFEVNGNSYSAGDSVELDGGTLVLNADGSYSFTPNADWNGNVPVVTYTTNTGATATLTIVVTPVDDATNAVNDFNTVAEDTVASGNVLDNDSDVDDELSVVSFEVNGNSYSAGDSVELDGGTLVLNADGSYSFTPNADWNGNVPVVTYTTNTGATATLTIVVTPVDDATNAVNDFNTVAEDTVASGNVLDNDSDVDDDLTVVSFEVNGNSYSAGDSVELDGGTLVLNADGSYSFTPNADWNGNVPVVTYTTNTGATATLTIVVTPVDDATNAVNDFNTVAEDTVASGNVLDNDSDIDSELSVVSFEVNGNSYSAGDSVELDGGTLVLNADGSYSFTPNADWNGNVPVVTYTTNTGATATLTIVVTPVDDATNAVNDFNTVAEDTVASGNVLDNDSDVDDDLTVVSFEVNGNSYSAGDSVELDGGTLVLNADGSYSFTPNADWNGNVPVVTYTTNTGATATLTIVVTPVDDATNAVNDFNTVAEDTVASGNVLDNDSDIDSELSVVSFEVNGNSYSAGDSVELDGGTLVLNADGSYSFTPNADWNGNVPVVTYTTNTGATATLTIVVTPVDDATNAVNDFNTVAEDTVASGNVLDNDSDVDDELSVVSFEVNGNSYSAGDSVELDGGTLVLNADGSYSFTPNDNWNGNVPVVTYTTNTGATATLTIVVTPDNDEPVALANSYSVDEGDSVSGNIITDDTGTGVDSDPEGDELNITHINGEQINFVNGVATVAISGGTLTINQDGSFSYSHDGSEPAPISFTYTVADGNGGTDTATVSITVNPVDDIAIANDDSFSVMEDQTSDALDLLGNDIGEGLTIKSINGVLLTGGEQSIAVDHGTIFINAEGEITFTPTANYSGPVTFDYVIEDLDGGEATATVTGTVIPVADIAGQEFGVTLGDVTEVLINFDSGYTTYNGTGSHSNDIVKIVYEDGTTITTREGESLSVSNGQGIGVGRGGDFRIDGDDYMNIDLPSYLTDIALTFKNASGQTITFTMHNIDGTTTVQSYTFSGNQNSQETMVLHSEVAFNSFSFELSGSSNGGNGSTLLSMTTSGVTQSAYVYPITASYEFTDLDGSESIQSITLSGFPAGAKIYSAQDASLEIHDNGDGTWTIDSSVFTDNGGIFTFDDWVVQTQSPLENGFSPRLEIVIQDGTDTSISIRGGSASSDLIGGDGNDYLDGESGDDMLIGGQGDDTLIGGLGADTFVWQAGDTGTDHIVDFDISQDKLDLSDLLQGEDQYSLEGFLSFTIENGSTTIEIDADKDGQVDQRIVLDGVDLAAEYGVEATNETGIINGLLGDGNGPLIIDTTSDSPGIQSVSSGSSTLDEQSHNFSGHYIP